MRKVLVTSFLFFFVILSAQDKAQDSIDFESFFVFSGDTIPRNIIPLNEVIIFQPLKFKTYDEARKYLILRKRTIKVYPYARLSAIRLEKLNERLKNLKSKSKRKKYLKNIESFIYDEFEEELKKLSRSQGRILIKLVHRQTGLTSHELVKDLRNGWRAFIYQTTASLFKLSLKDVYNPKEEYQDYLIEDILQRAFSDKILEFQPTALNYNLDSLYIYWNKNKPNPLNSIKLKPSNPKN